MSLPNRWTTKTEITLTQTAISRCIGGDRSVKPTEKNCGRDPRTYDRKEFPCRLIFSPTLTKDRPSYTYVQKYSQETHDKENLGDTCPETGNHLTKRQNAVRLTHDPRLMFPLLNLSVVPGYFGFLILSPLVQSLILCRQTK